VGAQGENTSNLIECKPGIAVIIVATTKVLRTPFPFDLGEENPT